MAAPDLELKKAFGELQTKMVESKQVSVQYLLQTTVNNKITFNNQ